MYLNTYITHSVSDSQVNELEELVKIKRKFGNKQIYLHLLFVHFIKSEKLSNKIN